MRAIRGERTAPSDRELRLWKVGRALTVTFAAAVLAAGSVLYSLVYLLDFQEIDTGAKLDAKTLFEVVKLSFGVVAGAGALVALVVAYRRQRVDEAGAYREATRLHTERFSQAVDKLGSDSPAVRLGGVHALAGLADDAPTRGLRQTCIDVLCAYLRLPYLPEADLLHGDTGAWHEYVALREIRHTIIRLVRDRLRLPADAPHSWQGHDFDFTGVAFDGGDLTGAVFSSGKVSFYGAAFHGRVFLNGTRFCGAMVSFTDAGFHGGEISFADAQFIDGEVSFAGTGWHGGKVSFAAARFSGGMVPFTGAGFHDTEVNFTDAQFIDGEVSFAGTGWHGGKVSFAAARLCGGRVSFTDAGFHDTEIVSGGVSLDGAEFFDGRDGTRPI
ncbi:pentapeptide repeat-containing protein [Streptomyces sp. NPDC039028]|uniref:pentapeptide repeat-containing protein n=1 Tax=unclassified Streptomyces TaxID=2593676 RepID=UPI0033F6CAD3